MKRIYPGEVVGIIGRNGAGKMVDRIGAGIVIILITAIHASLNAPADIIRFIVNATASMPVSTAGHLTSIEAVGLIRMAGDY
jgi:ABC-type lipopolysaccharide export system ATPase subunit